MLINQCRDARGVIDFDKLKKWTLEALADPQPGDLFEEHYTYWARVLKRDGEDVKAQWTTVENGERVWTEPRWMTVSEFEKRHLYGNIPGAWVYLCERAAQTEESSL